MRPSYQNFQNQSLNKDQTLYTSEIAQNQVALTNSRNPNRPQISPLIPEDVVRTLSQKEEYKQRYIEVIKKKKKPTRSGHG